jgi:hypothetical protein
VVAERFELVDEAACVAFGVAALEVVAVPISATITSAVRPATQVMVAASATPRASGRAQLGLDRVGESLDLLVEEVQVGEDRADHQRVVGSEAPLERFAQGGELGAQSALGQLGQHVRVGRARDERVEHAAAGQAEDVAWPRSRD